MRLKDLITGLLLVCAAVSLLMCLVHYLTISTPQPDGLREELQRIRLQWEQNSRAHRRNGEPATAYVLEDCADLLRFTLDQYPQP